MHVKSKRLLSVFIIGLSTLAACKKGHDVVGSPVPATPPPVAVTTDPVKIKDSSLLYSKDVYLWYNQIPETFDARSYSDPAEIMTAIRQYSIEPGFSGPVDKWSFAMKKTEWDNLSGGLGTTFGSATPADGDFGFGVFFLGEGDLRVKSVERESPAGLAGMRRGWRITKINDNNSIITANANFIITNVYKSTKTTFTFIKPTGETVDITLTAAHYREHPVYFDSVYAINSKKIGYLVFNSFLGDTTEMSNEFSRVFNKFSAQQVSEVVIDLRYNGGGYVSMQEKMANYLASASANNALMMKEQYNDKNSAYNHSTYFKKQGNLNLSRIFFIVTNNTASASELLINNLKPYMDVKLVGPTNTHGKPVGFFPIPVGDWYIFPVSFKTTNKNGEGSYFKGFPVDAKVNDGLSKDWGDVSESCFASAIRYISGGSFRTTGDASFSEQLPQVTTSNTMLEGSSFKGSIETRRPFK